MRDADALLLGAAVGAGFYVLRPRRASAQPAPADGATATDASLVLDFGRPVAPQVRAVVSSGWSKLRDGGKRAHRALDIPLRDGTELLAMADGEVARVRWDEDPDAGLLVVVVHPAGIVSRYLHLSQPLVKVGQRVRRGDVVALSGNTGNSERPHLHLDLRAPLALLAPIARAIGMPRPGWGAAMRGTYSIPGEPFVPVDEYRSDVRDDAARAGIPLYRGALVVPLATDASTAQAIRNGALVYRGLGERGQRYPQWVHDLKGKSGVYVIRERGQVVYVGQSSAGKLYSTLTRHFQEWRRWKGFWRSQYTEGHDPGLTYDRSKVEVAVRVLPADRAVDEEARLIRRLQPRDNVLGQPETDDVPF